VEWYIGPRTRCDLVGYGGVNLTGPRAVVRIFPTGARKGTFETHKLKSIVVLAPVGTRVILATSPRPEGWEERPWRCIRMVAGSMFTNPEGQSGVRVPDLDWLDPPEAKKTSTGMQTGFPLVTRLADGTGYSFGKGGGNIKDAVVAIWVEREAEPISKAP
jgi:hypothetical protein